MRDVVGIGFGQIHGGGRHFHVEQHLFHHGFGLVHTILELSTSIRFVARCPMMAFWAGMASLRAMYFKVNFVAP